MGMDSYLYTIDKKKLHDYLDAVRLKNEAYDRNVEEIYEAENKLSAKWDLFRKKYPSIEKSWFCRRDLAACATNDELAEVDAMLDRLDDLRGERSMDNVDQDPGTEVMYWRKPYGLHDYVCRRCLPHGAGDNCVRIEIPRDVLRDMRDEMRRCIDGGFQPADEHDNPFGDTDEGCWSLSALEDTEKLLRKLLEELDDDQTVYYYAWY